MAEVNQLLKEHNESSTQVIELYKGWKELISPDDVDDEKQLEVWEQVDESVQRLKPLSLDLCEALNNAEVLEVHFMLETKEIIYRIHFQYSRRFKTVGLYPYIGIHDDHRGLLFAGAHLAGNAEGDPLFSVDPVTDESNYLNDVVNRTLGNYNYHMSYFSELPFMICHDVRLGK